MTIEYRNKYGSITNEKSEVVEKLKVLAQDRRMRTNPFIKLRAVPIMEEGGENGGKVRFSTIMGMQAATRRTAPPTGNTYEYGNNIKTREITLVIDEPLETPDGKLIPTSRTDTVQTDGIDFTPVAASKTMKILVDGEIKEDIRAITEDANVRVLTYDDAATDKYTQMRFATHRAIASYYDVSSANAAYWTNSVVYDYFDAKSYSYLPEEIHVFANPSDIAEMSLELLENNVSNGDGVYQEAIQGKVPMIAGRPINQSRYVPKGEMWVSVNDTLGTPTGAVAYTLIKTSESAKGDLGTYGKHYYNSILVAPELFTRIVPASAVAPLKAQFEANNKLFKESNVVAIKPESMTKDERIEILNEDIKELESHLEKASKPNQARIKMQILDKKDLIARLEK